jgi:ribosomal peptide maturation radical SAM protein 1
VETSGITRRDVTDIILISMPWAALHRTPIQLGILQSVVQRAGFSVATRCFNLTAMEYLASQTKHLPKDSRITFDDYVLISEQYYEVGLGEWIFAIPPYMDLSAKSDEEYFEYIRGHGAPETTIAKARLMRELVPGLLENCVDDIISIGPRMLGLTTCFGQNVPSLLLSRMVKQRCPNIHIVFGGSNCEGPMGAALHRLFPWIDTVVRGEAEDILPALMGDVIATRTIQPQPGLCYRQGDGPIVVDDHRRTNVSMNSSPAPNYDEYFERLQGSELAGEIMPRVQILFESARGCWWGEKMHCTFCGLNGSNMAFRSKSASQVAEDVFNLASRYHQTRFEAVDNIIDMRYLQDLLPKLRRFRDEGYDFSFFYETKANLKKDHLWAMRNAGVLVIQPGIESLSSTILKMMRKGVTALQNIRLLKWAKQFGISVQWNLLHGFPGEPLEEYELMTDVMSSIIHLQPPRMSRLVVERFSPYHQTPELFGLTDLKPYPFYKFIYPVSDADLNELAYDFTYEYKDTCDRSCFLEKIRAQIETWRDDYEKGTSSLTYKRGPGFLVISDRRANLEMGDYQLGPVEAEVYLACDGGATPKSVLERLRASGYTRTRLAEVTEFLVELLDAGLVYEENGRYLSLALCTNDNVNDSMPRPLEATRCTGPASIE